MEKFIESLVNGNVEEFRQNIYTTLYAKAEEALNDRRAEIAAGLYGENLEEQNKSKKKGDGNLANNYPPYDKVTRGDIIAGAKGQDQMGGKNK